MTSELPETNVGVEGGLPCAEIVEVRISVNEREARPTLKKRERVNDIVQRILD